MPAPVRFWGTIKAVHPRLVLTRFEGETTPKCHGYLLAVEGTTTIGSERPVAGRYLVAIGPATQKERHLGVGYLVRGDAHPVPEGLPDTFADLYRVGTFHVIASGPSVPPPSDPPRTDLPLTPEQIETSSRRALSPTNLDADGPCAPCPYGTVVAVVTLSDPRDYRGGKWASVPACLGPIDCPYYVRPDG